MRVAPGMRWVVIGFWLVVMSLVWLMPNSMGRIAQWFVTAWFGAIAGLGLLVLHRLERTALLERRASAGRCLECGDPINGARDRCSTCGGVTRKAAGRGEADIRR